MNNSCEDEIFSTAGFDISILHHHVDFFRKGLVLPTILPPSLSQLLSHLLMIKQIKNKQRESQRLFNIKILRHVVTWSNTAETPVLPVAAQKPPQSNNLTAIPCTRLLIPATSNL